MSMNPQTQSEYQPGGWRYNNIATNYGTSAADAAAKVAASGGEQSDVTVALNKYRSQYADPGSESTLGNFWRQITTDPLAAPLESANNQIGNAVSAVFRNPWVLLALALLIFHLLGGFDMLKRKFARA